MFLKFYTKEESIKSKKPMEPNYLEKLSFGEKFQKFLQCYLKQLISTLDLYLEVTLNGRKDLRLPLLVGCGQWCLSSNQIEGIFDHQYMCKKYINTIDFLHGDNHQQKKRCQSTTFAWVLLVVLLVQ